MKDVPWMGVEKLTALTEPLLGQVAELKAAADLVPSRAAHSAHRSQCMRCSGHH